MMPWGVLRARAVKLAKSLAREPDACLARVDKLDHPDRIGRINVRSYPNQPLRKRRTHPGNREPFRNPAWKTEVTLA